MCFKKIALFCGALLTVLTVSGYAGGIRVAVGVYKYNTVPESVSEVRDVKVIEAVKKELADKGIKDQVSAVYTTTNVKSKKMKYVAKTPTAVYDLAPALSTVIAEKAKA